MPPSNSTPRFYWMKHFAAFLLLILPPLFSGSAEPARVEREGTVFLVYDVEPSKIDFFWIDRAGNHYGQFGVLQKALAADSRCVEFMMNGGIFQTDGDPCGLAVIDGKTVHPLNTSAGPVIST